MQIWPGDLVFYPRCSSFELDLEIIKTNTLSQIHDDCFKNVTTRVLTRFSADLARRPSFWPQVTQFQTYPRLIKTNILNKIHDYCFKNVTAWVLTRFSAGWPGDLVFDTTWPHFNLDLEIIKTNILSKIHDGCLKNVTARVLTRFSADLARWPSFWLQVTQFQTWPRNHQDKHFEQDSWWLLQKCDC